MLCLVEINCWCLAGLANRAGEAGRGWHRGEKGLLFLISCLVSLSFPHSGSLYMFCRSYSDSWGCYRGFLSIHCFPVRLHTWSPPIHISILYCCCWGVSPFCLLTLPTTQLWFMRLTYSGKILFYISAPPTLSGKCFTFSILSFPSSNICFMSGSRFVFSSGCLSCFSLFLFLNY